VSDVIERLKLPIQRVGADCRAREARAERSSEVSYYEGAVRQILSQEDTAVSVSVSLNTDIAPHPEYTLELAGEAVAGGVRVLNHQTRHHEALRYPAEADTLIRYLAMAASRLPQLFGQIGGWLDAEQAAGGLRVPQGEYAGRPDAAVIAAGLDLEAASVLAEALQQALYAAASRTTDLAAADPGPEDDEDDD
jgi:hypothetical protein